MGGLFKTPKAKSEPVAQPQQTAEPAAAAASSTETDSEVAARRQRVQAVAEQRRGRAATIATSARGLLDQAAGVPVRKSLLGE